MMDYAKDEVFEVTYRKGQDQFRKEKKRITGRIIHLCQRHKWLTFLLLSFLFFSSINIILITQFMKLIQTLRVVS